MSSVKKNTKINLFTLYTSWKGQYKDRNFTAGINAHKVSYPLAHLSPGLSFKNHGRYFMKSFSFGLPWIDFPIGHPIHTEELSEKKNIQISTSAWLTSTWSQPLTFSQPLHALINIVTESVIIRYRIVVNKWYMVVSWWLFINCLGTPNPKILIPANKEKQFSFKWIKKVRSLWTITKFSTHKNWPP